MNSTRTKLSDIRCPLSVQHHPIKIEQLANVSVTYPSGQFETRTVSVGGKSKQQLLAQLAEAGVELNEAARILFSSDKFTTLNACQALITVELTVRHLGFTHGATTSELYGKAVA